MTTRGSSQRLSERACGRSARRSPLRERPWMTGFDLVCCGMPIAAFLAIVTMV